jgi:RNA polymerase sigma factor (sigma-70 family)
MSNNYEYMGEDFKRYMDTIKGIPRIDKEEEKKLSSIILSDADSKEKDDAIKKLANSNLMLVVKLAINYHKFVSKGAFGISIMDLIAEGNIALIKAAITFDASQSKFSTYSSYYIKRAFQNYKIASNMIRIPVNHVTIANALKRIEDENRVITEEDKKNIAEKVNCSIEQIDFVIKCRKTHVISSDKTDPLDDSIIDNVPSKDKHVSTDMMLQEDNVYLMDKIEALSEIEKDIVMQRFFSDDKRTIVEIAKEKGVSRQRISKILKRAMGKLKSKITMDKAKTKFNE